MGKNAVCVERSITIAAPQREVFEYVADCGSVLAFMHKVRRFEPIGPKHYGLGARFYWETVVKGLTLGWEFVVTEFVPYEWMSADGLSVPRSNSSWHFRKVEDGTLAIFATALELPRGLIPLRMGKWLLEHEIAANMERSLINLRHRLESSFHAETRRQLVAKGQLIS